MILSLAILLNLLVICDALQIRWNRPRLIEKGAEISNFANGPESFNGLHKLVGISVCSSPEIKANPGASYRWTFTNSTGKNVGGKTENSCSTTWYAPMEGKYTVKAEMTVGGKMIATTQTVLDVRDLWFVLIGDSFVSGKHKANKY